MSVLKRLWSVIIGSSDCIVANSSLFCCILVFVTNEMYVELKKIKLYVYNF